MKKILSAILCMVLAVAVMSGCGTTKTTGNGANTSADAPASGTSDTTSSSAGGDSANSVQRGTWNDKVYTNDFAKLKFTNPDGWTATSSEEIAQQTGISADISGAALSEEPVIYDMMTGDNANSSVSVMMENVNLSNIGDISAKDYIAELKAQLTSSTASGITYTVEDNSEDKEICGNSYNTLTAKAESGGVTMSQTYLIRREGSYMIDIVITTRGDATLEDILTNFGD